MHARLLDVIGQLSLDLGQLNEAQRRLEQAVAIRRSAADSPPLDLGEQPNSPRVGAPRPQRLPAAIKLVDEALAIRRAALPPDHPDVADALYERGWLSYSTEQEGLYRQALAILSDTVATADRRLTLLLSLSTNLRRQGRLAEAVASAREALAMAERSFGPDHHATGQALIHLADHVYDIEPDVAGAERLYRRGLDLLTRRFGDDSIRLIHGLNSLASLLSNRGVDEAERHFRHALAISRSATGPEHPRVADQMQRLAQEVARQGRLAEAERLSREALDLATKMLGPRYQSVTATHMPQLARILDRQRRYADADEVYRLAFERAERPSNVIIGQMHREYGLMLLRRGDHARAEPQLLQSLAMLEQAYSTPGHPNLQETKRALMELYGQLRRPDAVERYRVPPGRFIPR